MNARSLRAKARRVLGEQLDASSLDKARCEVALQILLTPQAPEDYEDEARRKAKAAADPALGRNAGTAVPFVLGQGQQH